MQMVESLGGQGMAWRPFNWSHPRGLADGAPAERHGCLLGFGKVVCLVCLVCLVPGTGFAHVDLGRDPPGLFLACNRGGLHSFGGGQDVRGDWLAFLCLLTVDDWIRGVAR